MKSFETNNVLVRKFEMKDAEQAYYDLAIYDDLNDITEEIIAENINKTKIIIKSAINEYYTDEPVWAVEDKQNKQLIGFIRVCNYSRKNKICNITWSMSNKFWNSNLMKDALIQILKYLFTEKDIDLIECSYYEKDNKNACLLESVGMIKEAVLRNRRYNEKTKKFENFIIYSINKNEFNETCKI